MLTIVNAAASDLEQSEQAVFEAMFGESNVVRKGYPFSQNVYRAVRRTMVDTAKLRRLPEREIIGIAHTDYEAAMGCWPKLAAALRNIDKIGNDRASTPQRPSPYAPHTTGVARKNNSLGVPGAYVGYWIPSETKCDAEAIHIDSYLQVRLRRIVQHETVCEIENVAAQGSGHALQAACEEAGNRRQQMTIRLTFADGLLVKTLRNQTNAYRQCSTDPDWQPLRKSGAAGPTSTSKQ